MGLSVAMCGGIVCATIIAVFSIVSAMTGQIYEINSSRTKAVDLQNIVSHTNMDINNITTISGNQFVNFTLKNTGTEKLWNYNKFDIIINYTADVGGLATPRSEHITYLSSADNISLDQVSTLTDNCVTCTLSHTVAGPNKLLVVAISIGDSTTVNSVTYSGQSLTFIRFDEIITTDRRSELWYLVNPPSGVADVVATLDTNEKVVMGAISFNHVHQSNPIDTHNGDTDVLGITNPSVGLTTTANNALIVDVVSTRNGPMTPDASQTERWDLNQGPLRGSGSTKQTTNSGPYTMSWTNDDILSGWAISAVALRPLDPSCGPDGGSGTNSWIINSISDDYVDPRIINTNEGALICTKLAYPVYTNGFVRITVSTDGGYTKSNSTRAT